MIKLLLIFALVLSVIIFKAAAADKIGPTKKIIRSGTTEIEVISQKLNHFNYSDTRTMLTIFILHAEFYKPDGPLFVYINDFLTYGNNPVPPSAMFDKLVKEHNGITLMFLTRYFERSVATPKDIQYFTVEQSLADLSYLIRTIKKTYDDIKNAKVIIVGSYTGGSLATWFKKLYPDLVDGVWASGAPLLAKADFSEYYELLGQSIKELGGDACYNRIKDGFAELELMLSSNRQAEVKEMFNLYDTFDGSNELDVSVLFSKIVEAFDFNIQQHHLTIPKLCDYVMKQPSDVTAIAHRFVETWANNTRVDSSYRFYIDEKNKYKYELPRLYQQCNQFGWFKTSSSPNQPFGNKNPLSFFNTVCKDVFGDKYTINDMENNIREFNDNYGGIDLKLENVYLTYGELDPWRALGMRSKEMATTIPSCGHGCDFWLAESDAPELEASHKRVDALVTKWLEI